MSRLLSYHNMDQISNTNDQKLKPLKLKINVTPQAMIFELWELSTFDFPLWQPTDLNSLE